MVLWPSGVTRIRQRAVPGPCVAVDYARRLYVVAEHRAEIIVPNLAEISRAPAKGPDSGGGIGGRAARELDCGSHRPIESLGRRHVYQDHGPFVHGVFGEESIVGMGDDVDDGVTDADDIEAALQTG